MSNLSDVPKSLDECSKRNFFKVILIVMRACSHAFSPRTLIETLRSALGWD